MCKLKLMLTQAQTELELELGLSFAKIMTEIVTTNFVDIKPPDRQPTAMLSTCAKIRPTFNEIAQFDNFEKQDFVFPSYTKIAVICSDTGLIFWI